MKDVCWCRFCKRGFAHSRLKSLGKEAWFCAPYKLPLRNTMRTFGHGHGVFAPCLFLFRQGKKYVLTGKEGFCRYVIQQDVSGVALDLRETHRDDFFSVTEDNPLEDFLQTTEETAREDSDPEQAAMVFICKRLQLNYKS